MKKINIVFCAIVLMFLTVACKKNNEVPNKTSDKINETHSEITEESMEESTEKTNTADKYVLISDKFPTYCSHVADEIYVEKKLKLYMRDMGTVGQYTKELSVWDEDSLVWTTINDNQYYEDEISIAFYADQVGDARPGSYWLIDTVEGIKLLMVSVSIDGDKLFPRYEIVSLLYHDSISPAIKNVESYGNIELYLASDGICPVEASFQKNTIYEYVDLIQKYFDNAELIYQTEINTGNVQMDELISFFIDIKDMNNDRNKLEEIINNISQEIVLKEEINIPACNFSGNGLITGHYEGEFFCSDEADNFHGACYLDVYCKDEDYSITMICEKMISLDCVASCKDGIIEMENSLNKLKLTFIDDYINVEIIDCVGELAEIEKIILKKCNWK